MSYITVSDVQSEASLSNNIYITDDDYKAKISSAETVVNSFLYGKYGVPFADNEIPPMIAMITLYLAAGYLLKKDYGPMHPGDPKDGDDKIKTGTDLLLKIQAGKITLVDANGVSLLSSDKLATSSVPNDAMSNNSVNTDGTSGPYFKMDKKW